MGRNIRMDHQIKPVRDAQIVNTVGQLFREYADWLAIDLSFYGFDEEVAQLPDKCAPPAGDLLLAWSVAGEALGCADLRPLEMPGASEAKRLYVRAAARGNRRGPGVVRGDRRTRRRFGLPRGDTRHFADHDVGDRPLSRASFRRDSTVLEQYRPSRALLRQAASTKSEWLASRAGDPD